MKPLNNGMFFSSFLIFFRGAILSRGVYMLQKVRMHILCHHVPNCDGSFMHTLLHTLKQCNRERTTGGRKMRTSAEITTGTFEDKDTKGTPAPHIKKCQNFSRRLISQLRRWSRNANVMLFLYGQCFNFAWFLIRMLEDDFCITEDRFITTWMTMGWDVMWVCLSMCFCSPILRHVPVWLKYTFPQDSRILYTTAAYKVN